LPFLVVLFVTAKWSIQRTAHTRGGEAAGSEK